MSQSSLEFLWLELTNRCNLQCGHCYAESGPKAGDTDTMTSEEYEAALSEAYARGCRAVQFIGGEPTLNRGLPRLIRTARLIGYEMIEVYTNLFSVSKALWREFTEQNVQIATSFYSATPNAFDAITTREGSFARVVENIKLALSQGIALRVGVIAFEHTKNAIDSTVAFLTSIGVEKIGIDNVRAFGRGADKAPHEMKNLCGNCANGLLVVGPDGTIAPCIMSKAWSVGNLKQRSLSEILESAALADTRRLIREATREGGDHASVCQPNDCSPYFNCNPNTQCNPCAPNGGHKCMPNHNCNPGKIEQAAALVGAAD